MVFCGRGVPGVVAGGWALVGGWQGWSLVGLVLLLLLVLLTAALW